MPEANVLDQIDITANAAQRDAATKAMSWRAGKIDPAWAAAWDGDTDDTSAKAVSGKKWTPDSPLHLGEEQLKSLFVAGQQRLTGFTAKVGIETKGMGQWNIGTKAAVGEGPPGTVLPPEAFRLPYEPDRLFEHFVGARADSQSVTYLEHTSNTGSALPVAELAQKPDLGIVIVPKTVSFTLVAVLQSFSRQLADDFASWMAFVPNELTRAVID